ncbi:hypothetical protein REPUB_Repub05bG0192100 [Reevesia pubescens]
MRISSNSVCPRCQIEDEDILHLLRDCPSSKYVWSSFLHGYLFDKFSQLPLHE